MWQKIAEVVFFYSPLPLSLSSLSPLISPLSHLSSVSLLSPSPPSSLSSFSLQISHDGRLRRRLFNLKEQSSPSEADAVTGWIRRGSSRRRERRPIEEDAGWACCGSHLHHLVPKTKLLSPPSQAIAPPPSSGSRLSSLAGFEAEVVVIWVSRETSRETLFSFSLIGQTLAQHHSRRISLSALNIIAAASPSCNWGFACSEGKLNSFSLLSPSSHSPHAIGVLLLLQICKWDEEVGKDVAATPDFGSWFAHNVPEFTSRTKQPPLFPFKLNLISKLRSEADQKSGKGRRKRGVLTNKGLKKKTNGRNGVWERGHCLG